MLKKLKNSFFFPLLFLNTSLMALSLEEVLHSTRQHFPTIVAAQKDKEMAHADVQSADGAFDLRFRNRLAIIPEGYYQQRRIDSVLEQPTSIGGTNLFMGYRLGTGDFAIYDEKAKTLPQGELRAGVEIPLWRDLTIDRRRSNREKAQLGKEMAGKSLEQQQLEVQRIASQRYWMWFVAGKRAEIMNSLLKIAEARDMGLSERVKHGDLPKFEQRDNQRTVLQRKTQVIQAERQFEQAAIELSLFYRDSNGQPILLNKTHLPPKIPNPSDLTFHVEQLVESALERRPEIKRFSLLKNQNQIEKDWSENQLSPKVDLQLQVSRDIGSGDKTRQSTEFEAGVVIEIPLERNTQQGRIGSVTANQEKIEVQSQFMRQRVVADVHDAFSALTRAKERVTMIQEELQFARELEKGERKRFEHGDSTILIVNLREQSSADTAIKEVETLAEYQIAKVFLGAAVGNIDLSL